MIFKGSNIAFPGQCMHSRLFISNCGTKPPTVVIIKAFLFFCFMPLPPPFPAALYLSQPFKTILQLSASHLLIDFVCHSSTAFSILQPFFLISIVYFSV